MVPADVGSPLPPNSRARSTGLVVDDEERARPVAVDPVGRAAEPERAPVRQDELDCGPLGLRQSEPEFGGERREPEVGAHLGVFGEEAVEVGEDPAPIAVPERAPAGETERLVPVAADVGDLVEPRPVGVGPGRAGRWSATGATQDLAEELVERLVDERTAIEGRQLPHLFGKLGDLHPEDVVHQIVEGRDRPAFEPRGGHDGIGSGGARHGQAAEVAVECV